MSSLWIVLLTFWLFFEQLPSSYQRTLEFPSDLSNSHGHSGNDSLIFVHTICRHGDRNILRPYPKDPWKSEAHWPGGFGELTNIGKRQHYLLGQYLRQRYASLIGSGGYSSKKIFIQSTDMDRTIMSAEANLAGLFPPAENQKWDRTFNWQPIPVHAISASEDYILATSKQCDRFDYLMSDHLNRSNYKGLFKKHRKLLKYLETNSGAKIETLKDLLLLYDTLKLEKDKGKRLPEWAMKVMEPSGAFESLAQYYYQIFTLTSEMKKIMSGFLLREILERFSKKFQSLLTPDRSIWMYFAHDVTILNMLNSLGLYEPNIPPCASCLFFELYNSDVGPYIKLFYKTSLDKEAQYLEIPDCGPKCALSDFYKLYWDILPMRNFEDECMLRDGEFLPVNGNQEGYSLLIKNHRHSKHSENLIMKN